MQPAQDPRPDAPHICEEGGLTIVKARNAADLLGLVPHLAGVQPADSLVVVVFRGTRTAGALRLDLPGPLAETGLKRWSGTVLGMICKVQDVTGIAPVVYTSATFAPSGRPPHADLLRALEKRATRMGFEIKDRLVVAADGWGSLEDPALPRGGRPLGEITVLDDDRFGPVRERVAPQAVPATEEARRRFAAQYEAWWTRPEGPGGTLHGVRLAPRGGASGPAAAPAPAMERYRWGGDRATVLELVERMLDPHEEGDGPCPCRALLACFAEREGLNGILLAQWGWGRELAARVWAASDGRRRDAPALGDLMRALSGDFRRPDGDRLQRGIDALLATAAHLPEQARGPVDAMLAWLHWALGSGSIGAALAERSRAAGRTLDLAALVERVTAAGGLPEWAFRADPDADPLPQAAGGDAA